MKINFTILILAFSNIVYGQLDTMVVYDLISKTNTIIPPITYDESITSDRTSSSVGSMEGFQNLSNEIPTENLFENTDFTRLEKTADLFDVRDYPLRTSVKLEGISINGFETSCSGTLISENMVITAGHCTFDWFVNEEWNIESMVVLPSFDNGTIPMDFPTANVTKVFISKKTLDGESFFDVCILLLDEPIGKTLGYQGFGFAQPSQLTEKVLHKISYPAVNSTTNPVQFYIGDTTYYNHGLMIFDDILGLIKLDPTEAQGIPGQSGSSIFESKGEEQTIYGILSFSNYNHFRILPNFFYQLKNIVDIYGGTNTAIKSSDITSTIAIEPNPFNIETTITLSDNQQRLTSYQIIDLKGQIIQSGTFFGDQFILNRNNLSSGIYLLHLSLDNGRTASKRIVVT